MTPLLCSATHIDATLAEFREAGNRHSERVVLWLSERPVVPGCTILETYVPEQETDVDYFRIPQRGMTALMKHLRGRRLGLAAQVHSHPAKAFHSLADDKWAIVRHEGALSLVVPYFASGVTAENFVEAIAAYRLSPDDRWIEISKNELSNYFRVT